jgi:hypothetical protein
VFAENQKNAKPPLEIYGLYFDGLNSALEVNVPHQHCAEIFEKLKTGTYHNHLFDGVRDCLLENIGDSYSRFIMSVECERILKPKLRRTWRGTWEYVQSDDSWK